MSSAFYPGVVGDWSTSGARAKASAADRLRTGLMAALILAMPVTQVVYFGGKPTNMAASDLVLPFGILFLGWQLLKGQLQLPMFRLFCLNFASVIASLIVNLDGAVAMKGTSGVIIEAIKMVPLWLLVYILANAIRTRADLQSALKFWVIGAALEALTGIGGALAFQMTGVVNDYSLMFRAQGTLGDANLFGDYLAVSFFVALAYRKLAGNANWVFLPMALYITGIFFSASRGCMLAFAVALSILFAVGSSWKTRVLVGGTLLLGAAVILAIPDKNALLASNPFTERFATATVSIEDDAAADRRELWEGAAQGFSGSPLFGIGHGYFHRPSDSDPEATSQIHNTYLGLLCETGLVGFSVYMLIFGGPALAILRRRFSRRGDRLPSATLFALMALLVMALGALTISIENFRGLWVLVALLECYRRTYGEDAVFSGARA